MHWTDYKNGGNFAKCIGLFKDKNSALSHMKTEMTILANETDKEVEEFSDGANITDGTDYDIFVIQKTVLL